MVVQKVTATANLGRVPCGTSDEYRYWSRGRDGLCWGLALRKDPRTEPFTVTVGSSSPNPFLCSHLRFAGRTLTSGSLVLLTLDARAAGAAQLTVNSEKMVIGTMLVKDVIQALTQ